MGPVLRNHGQMTKTKPEMAFDENQVRHQTFDTSDLTRTYVHCPVYSSVSLSGIGYRTLNFPIPSMILYPMGCHAPFFMRMNELHNIFNEEERVKTYVFNMNEFIKCSKINTLNLKSSF